MAIMSRVSGSSGECKCHDVAGRQHLVPRRIEGTQPGLPLVRGEESAHSERLADLRDALSERAFANDPEGAAVQVANPEAEEAELPTLLPAAAPHGLSVVTKDCARSAKIIAKVCSGTVFMA